jgi:type VI secretion system Hcp family effector
MRTFILLSMLFTSLYTYSEDGSKQYKKLKPNLLVPNSSNTTNSNSSNSSSTSTQNTVFRPGNIDKASYPFWIEITGANQGKISGSVVRKGLEGNIEGSSFHQIISKSSIPNLAISKNNINIGSITFLKVIDKSTTALLNAVVNNEVLTKVKFKFWGISGTTPQVDGMYYIVELKNARITKIETNLGIIGISKDNGDMHYNSERIEITFESITATWTDGNRTFQAP